MSMEKNNVLLIASDGDSLKLFHPTPLPEMIYIPAKGSGLPMQDPPQKPPSHDDLKTRRFCWTPGRNSEGLVIYRERDSL